MANHRKQERPCAIPGCAYASTSRGLCQHHYDVWYGKIRRERDKLRNREQPFLSFQNPYRQGTGYHIIFEVMRTSKPLAVEQIARLARIELTKAGLKDYRIDYALEVLKAKKHSSKRGDYQVRFDGKGRWHLVKDRPITE